MTSAILFLPMPFHILPMEIVSILMNKLPLCDPIDVIVEFGNNKNCRIPMQKAAIAQVEKPNAE